MRLIHARALAGANTVLLSLSFCRMQPDQSQIPGPGQGNCGTRRYTAHSERRDVRSVLILVIRSDLVEIKKQGSPRSTRLINGICFTRGNAIAYVEGNQKGESENASVDRCAKTPPLVSQPGTDGPRAWVEPGETGQDR